MPVTGLKLHLLVPPQLPSPPPPLIRPQTPCLMPGSPDDLRDWSLDLSPRLVPRAGGRRPRESRTPPPTAGSSAIRHPTPALSLGSGALGLAVTPVDGLARPVSSSFSPPPSSPGTAKASSSTGAGGPRANRGRPPEVRRRDSPTSSTGWPGTIRPGAGAASRRNSPCSATRSPS